MKWKQDPIPRNLQFLPMSAEVIHEIDGSLTFDVAFVLDCGDLDRVGKGIERIRRLGQVFFNEWYINY